MQVNRAIEPRLFWSRINDCTIEISEKMLLVQCSSNRTLAAVKCFGRLHQLGEYAQKMDLNIIKLIDLNNEIVLEIGTDKVESRKW